MMKLFSIILGLLTLSQDLQANSIDTSDLLPGDLIFFMDSMGNHAEHVGVYSGIKADGHPYITHAVTHPYHALVTTLLKYQADTPIHVVRNHNLRLALSAHHRMKVWAEAMIPYDADAASMTMVIEDSTPFSHPVTGLEKYHRFAVEMGKLNFHRRIKYAARRMRPVLPAEDSIKSTGRGFRCAEAAILAYQIEEISDAVADLSGAFMEKIWVSDKYADPKLIEKLGATSDYKTYQASLIGRQTYTVEGKTIEVRNREQVSDHQQYYPSFMAWNSEVYGSIEDYQEKLNTCLPIDSKISSARLLYYHVVHDPVHWNLLGNLELPDEELSPFARASWRAEIQRRKLKAEALSEIAAGHLRKRAATASIETDFRSLAWDDEVEQILRCVTPKSPEARAERVTAILATPPRIRRERTLSEILDGSSLVDCAKALAFIETEEHKVTAIGVDSSAGAFSAWSSAGGAGAKSVESRKPKHPEFPNLLSDD